MVSALDLQGRTVAITGANSGIGLELARVVAAKGARVLALCRPTQRARDALGAVPGVDHVRCDLEEPRSVRSAVAQIQQLRAPLDAIVANAGIMAPPRLELVHGIERQFIANHVGHHLLVTSLVDQLAPDGRVVVVSSSLHSAAPAGGIDFENLDGSRGYSPWAAYGRSKLANILFTRALARRLPRQGQTANAVHPGVARTGLQRRLPPLTRALFAVGAAFSKSIAQAAATPAFVALHPDAAGHRGAYFVDCAPVPLSGYAADDALAERLFAKTDDIIARIG